MSLLYLHPLSQFFRIHGDDLASFHLDAGQVDKLVQQPIHGLARAADDMREFSNRGVKLSQFALEYNQTDEEENDNPVTYGV